VNETFDSLLFARKSEYGTILGGTKGDRTRKGKNVGRGGVKRW
jgi:hypothetical protein